MTLCLTPAELLDLTGYSQPKRQVEALHAAGFWRARLKDGQVKLEREHYVAVCHGARPEGKMVARVGSLKAA